MCAHHIHVYMLRVYSVDGDRFADWIGFENRESRIEWSEPCSFNITPVYLTDGFNENSGHILERHHIRHRLMITTLEKEYSGLLFLYTIDNTLLLSRLSKG